MQKYCRIKKKKKTIQSRKNESQGIEDVMETASGKLSGPGYLHFALLSDEDGSD